MCAKISLLAPPHTPDVCPLSSSHLRLKEPIKSFKGVNTCVKGVNTTALLAQRSLLLGWSFVQRESFAHSQDPPFFLSHLRPSKPNSQITLIFLNTQKDSQWLSKPPTTLDFLNITIYLKTVSHIFPSSLLSLNQDNKMGPLTYNSTSTQCAGGHFSTVCMPPHFRLPLGVFHLISASLRIQEILIFSW